MIQVIYIHWGMNDDRKKLMYKSIDSLLNSSPTEILVADNGGGIKESNYFLELCDKGLISVYTRFRNNMNIAFARNALLAITEMKPQSYIAIVDNDIVFNNPDWWRECVAFLIRNPGKYIASPLKADYSHDRKKFYVGEVDGWKLNTRAGSSCFVMRRETFEEIGYFDLVNLTGSKYADVLVRKGYVTALMPEPKAVDTAQRAGYNHKEQPCILEL